MCKDKTRWNSIHLLSASNKRFLYSGMIVTGTLFMGHSNQAIAADHYLSVGGLNGGINYDNDGATGRDSVAIGVGVVTEGSFSTAVGSYSLIENPLNAIPSSVQGGFATSYGTFNNTLTTDPTKVQSGLANVITGSSNLVDNSNGAIVMGSGNTITNSYLEVDGTAATIAAGQLLGAENVLDFLVNIGATDPQIAAAQANVTIAKTNLQNELMLLTTTGELGGTGIIGGGNTADNTTRSMITGIKNDYSNGDKNMISGYQNTVSGTTAAPAVGNTVIGSENSLTELRDNNFLVGSNNTAKGLNNSQILGSDLTIADDIENAVVVGSSASISESGGVALGYQSNANEGASTVSGYDIITDGASADTSSTWRGTTAAVSVGDVDAGITRRITDVAAGSADTDVVNVAQLKNVSTVVERGFGLQAQDGGQVNKALGEYVEVVGIGSTAGTYSANNVRTAAVNGKIQIQIAESPDFQNVNVNNAITVGENTTIDGNGLTIENGPSITTTGINAGDSVITNVAPGAINSTSTDAINGAQLYEVAQVANAGWNLSVNGSAPDNIGPNGTVNIVDGTNTIASYDPNTNALKISLVDAPTFEGKVTLNGGLSVAPEQTIDMGGNRVTNIGEGIAGTDAVNVNQLDSVDEGANAGTATAIALGNLPQATIAGKGLASIGGGYYEGESAVALGFSQMSDNAKWVLKAGASINSKNNVGVGASVGFHF